MSHGIIIKNKNIDVQVDGKARNYFIEKSGTFSFSGVSAWLGPQWVGERSVFSPLVEPWLPRIVAAKLLQNKYFCFFDMLQSGYFNYLEIRFMGECDESYSVDYSIWRYATAARPATPAEYGIHIYDDTGSYLIFSSGERNMRFVGTYEVDNPIYTQDGTPGAHVDVTVEDAFNNYFIMNPIGNCNEGLGLSGAGLFGYVHYWYMNMFMALNLTTVRIGTRVCGKKKRTGGSYQDPDGKFRYVSAAPKIILTEISDRPAA